MEGLKIEMIDDKNFKFVDDLKKEFLRKFLEKRFEIDEMKGIKIN